MSVEKDLLERSNNQCELCTATDGLSIYTVAPADTNEQDKMIYICNKCQNQIDKKEELDAAHWAVLTTTMWSEVPPLQVVSWRMLNRFRNESWAADALDMMYLDDEWMTFAKASGDHENDGSVELHRDSNGHLLNNNDSVVLIKSLDVKGSTLTASLGTVVKNIRLVPDNIEQIEGRVDGQLIVILTKYVRKN